MYFDAIKEARGTKDWSDVDTSLEYISKFQEKYGGTIIPSARKQNIEIWFNKLHIFSRISSYYGLLGFLILIVYFIGSLRGKTSIRILNTISFIAFLFLFLLHATGLVFWWYISRHAPWGNGYKSLIYISWTTVLAGIIFSKKSPVTLPITVLLAVLILDVAHLSWMDPEITHLVPVLKSIWLVIHVAIITASYGFLALGALMALMNFILIIFLTNRNKENVSYQIRNLSKIIEMTLIAGLYMLTIGTFPGGVWDNESWGRYWGWAPKESWALVTVIIYAFITHMRMIPGLRGTYALNLAALFGFFSVIMTYFGVNYYLAGLHSYAKGDPVPIPSFVAYTVITLVIITIAAFVKSKKLVKDFPKG